MARNGAGQAGMLSELLCMQQARASKPGTKVC